MKLALYTTLGLVAAAVTQAANNFYGLNYGVNEASCPNVDKLKQDFGAIQKYTNRVRTFALHVCNQADMAVEATQALGMNLYLGMWIDRQDTFDQEIQALKQLVNNRDLSNVDAVIVGSEVLYRGDADINTYANWIKQVKDVVGPKGVKVTFADVYYKIFPEIFNEVDFVMMNAFPYWEGVDINNAADTLMDHYHQVKQTVGDKDVKISETGWPSGGDNFGASVPSIENENKYMQDVLCKAKQNGIDVLYFSAKDEPYRNGVEGTFGVLDSNNQLKKGLTPEPNC